MTAEVPVLNAESLAKQSVETCGARAAPLRASEFMLEIPRDSGV
jgi:hypothetical protein